MDAGIEIVSNLLSGKPAFEGVGKAFGVGFVGGASGMGLVKGVARGFKFFKKWRLSRKMARVREVGEAGESAVRNSFNIGSRKLAIAKAKGQDFVIFVRKDTHITKPLLEKIQSGEIVLKYIPE